MIAMPSVNQILSRIKTRYMYQVKFNRNVFVCICHRILKSYNLKVIYIRSDVMIQFSIILMNSYFDEVYCVFIKSLWDYQHFKQKLNIIQRKLEGYDFPVFSTKKCPGNQVEWKKRSSAINCTEQNGYMCLPNENLTDLLEFCYIYPRILVQQGMEDWY